MSTLYRGGRVYSPGLPEATALLVEGDRVVWVGDGSSGAPAADTVVELEGGLLTPAFVDAHVHLTETGLALSGLDLTGACSISEVLDRVRAAATAPDGSGAAAGTVFGHGWDEGRLAEGRPPTAAELERAAPGARVYLSRVDVHSAVISPALATGSGASALPGWDGSGRVEREAHVAARRAARSSISAGQRRRLQLAALQAAAGAGIGSVHEMSAPDLADPEDLLALLDLTGPDPDPDAGTGAAGPAGPVLPEVVAYRAELVADAAAARAVHARFGGRLAGLAGDLCVDGSIGSRTAAFEQPYADAPECSGHLYLSVEQVRDHVAACTEAGLQAGFHVIGDEAVRTALRGIRLAAHRVGLATVRAAGHRLEHLEAVDDELVAELADLGVIASVQPAFDAFWGGPDGMYARRLGADRAAGLNPLARLLAADVPLALGSDTPVTPFGPWAAVRASAYHHESWHRLDVPAALDAHLLGGRRAARDGAEARLVPGAPATFAVWAVTAWAGRSAEPGHAGTVPLPDLAPEHPLPRCLRTVIRGRTAYQSA